MPLPWKKTSNKIDRVSRFVNEIRASKRGESLVLQPGFPTSLIDLIVKNRNRLNNNSSSTTTSSKKKNRRKNRVCSSFEEIESTPLPPFILNSISSTLLTDSSDSADSGKEICVLRCEEQDLKCGEGEPIIKIPVANRIFIICIQLFVILILALGTKKLAIVITLSAFLLMFIEILMKRLKVSIDLEKEETTNAVVTNFVDFRQEFDSLIKEKWVREIDIDLGKDDCDQKTGISEDCKEKIECAKIGNAKRTSSAKLRAKQFKNFVIKKFGCDLKNRKSNKEGMVDLSNIESNCATVNERVIRGGIGKDQEKDEGDEEMVVDGCDSISVSQVSSDMGCRENLGRTKNWSWRTFIPVGIILVGLVGGRIMALVLSIVGLVLINLHKLLRAPRGKYMFEKSCSKKCSSL